MSGASDCVSTEGQNYKPRKTLNRLSLHKVNMLKWIFSCYKAKKRCSHICRCRGSGNSCGSKNGGTTSTFESSAVQSELDLVIVPSNISSVVNDGQLGGGLDTLTHNSLHRSTSQYTVHGASAPDPFSPPSEIPSLPAVQMATLAQPQENKFAPLTQIPSLPAVQMATKDQPQANPFALPSEVLLLPDLQMATMGPIMVPSLPDLQMATMGPCKVPSLPDLQMGTMGPCKVPSLPDLQMGTMGPCKVPSLPALQMGAMAQPQT